MVGNGRRESNNNSAPEYNPGAVITSLPGELFGILAGNVMLTETATKLALDPLFKNFADSAGLKNLHRSSIIAKTIWDIVTDEKYGFASLSEFELKSIIFAHFQESAIEFVKAHPEVVPEMTRAWITSMLSKQKSQAEYEFNKFMAKVAGLGGFGIGNMMAGGGGGIGGPSEQQMMTLQAQFPKLQRNKENHNKVTCRCGLEGVLAVYSKGKDPTTGDTMLTESVRHFDPEKKKNTDHVIRRVSREEFVRLRKQYGTAPYGPRARQEQQVQISETAAKHQQGGQVKCPNPRCGLMGELGVYKNKADGKSVYYESVRHYDPEKQATTAHVVRRITEGQFLAFRKKHGTGHKGLTYETRGRRKEQQQQQSEQQQASAAGAGQEASPVPSAPSSSPSSPSELVKCPHKGCGLEGVMRVFVDRSSFYEGVRHYDPEKKRNSRHYTRRLDEAEYLALRKKYGVKDRTESPKSAATVTAAS